MNNSSEVKTCAIIVGAFKPYTAGHHFLVTTAAKDNELVIMYISQKDRKRKGEHPVTWEKMKYVWENFITPVLPKNVMIVPTDSPIPNLYNLLRSIDQQNTSTQTMFNLYMDDKDKVRYCYQDHEILEKFPRIAHTIKTNTFNRKTTLNVSGTQMRKTLQNNDLQGFTACLPDVLQDKAVEIFNSLI